MAERQKSPENVEENQKKGKIYGKPEKEVCWQLENDIFESQKTGNFLKTAETGKLSWKDAEKWKDTQRQWKSAKCRKTGEKATESQKSIKSSTESRKRTPFNPHTHP